MNSLFCIFEDLDDPRDERGKKHKLIDIIVMSIYGILCGFDDFYNIAEFLKIKEDYFTEMLDLKNGTPSHDTLSRVFAIINPDEFMKLFALRVKGITSSEDKVISIDGKAVRSATDKINKGNIPYIVSAFLSETGISIGQVKVDDKSNEITAIPNLLDLIEIKDSIITIDAIGTQTDIINKIIDKKGHYCLSVKTNQKLLFDDIDRYFKFALTNKIEFLNISTYTTSTKDHGRIEKREYYLAKNIDFITENQDKWSSVKTIGMIRNYREEYGELTIDDDYYILDIHVTPERFSEITRSHWSIENKLHWILDVILNEDHSRSRTDNSIHNLSLVRKICTNLIRLDDSFGKKSTKAKMMRYLFDFNTLKKLIFEIIPSKY